MTNFLRIFGVNNERNDSALYADISHIKDIDLGEPITYQWLSGSTEIEGANQDTLTKSDFPDVFDHLDLSVVVSYTDVISGEVTVASRSIGAGDFYLFTGGETGTLEGHNPVPLWEAYSLNGESSVVIDGERIQANETTNISVVSASSLGIAAREGDNVLRFYGNSSSFPEPEYAFRVELANADWTTKYGVGDNFYSSYSFYAPSEEWDPVTKYSIIINQWKQYSSGSPAFAIRLSNNGDYKVTLESLVEEYDRMTLTTIDPDKWVDVKTYTHFSKGTDGVLKIWINGELVFDYTGKTMMYESDYGYNTLGMYTEIRDERIIYFDAIEQTTEITTDFDSWLNNRKHLPTIDLAGPWRGNS